ncbi:hypothetical protein WAG13_27440, partial [Bacillus cereus]|uniref:hypothetical protein n=1 Tax=Bacillus cereus TaxID=1396 RepID=UPI003012A3F4
LDKVRAPYMIRGLLFCRYMLVSRYIKKIADIIRVAPIYLKNRRYNFIYRYAIQQRAIPKRWE